MDVDLGNTNRKKKFPITAIQEIILGYKFFPNTNYERINSSTTKYIYTEDIETNYSLKILKFLYQNADFPIRHIRLNEEFILSHDRIYIRELSNNYVIVERE